MIDTAIPRLADPFAPLPGTDPCVDLNEIPDPPPEDD